MVQDVSNYFVWQNLGAKVKKDERVSKQEKIPRG